MVELREFRKPLPPDCMLGRQVHPSILERLERVRELPVVGVANVIGVSQNEQGIELVWQWVEGQTLQEALDSQSQSHDHHEWFRKLEQIVSAMHAHGIVHGNLHARNIIINAEGRIHVTHLSPLLHDNIDVDEAALRQIRRLFHFDAGEELAINSVMDEVDPTARRYRMATVSTACLSLMIFLLLMWYIRSR